MTMPVFYLSHGGGPWPWMDQGPQRYADLQRSLELIPSQLPEPPKAILMVSAHWETQGQFLVQAHPNPPMVYDYYNFPEHTYHIRYPAVGDPDLALQVQQLLAKADLPADLDYERGFDHGAFVPAFVMYPNANIPMVQLSIDASYDPALHMQLGQTTRSLREHGVLIIASGASYHNLRMLGPEGAQPSVQFDSWLEYAMLNASFDERQQLMMDWESAPAARFSHAREDHLVPLFVAVGAASESDPVTRILNTTSSSGIMNASYRFG